jgi:hypothetical protein
MKKSLLIMLLVVILLTLGGCADHESVEQCTQGHTYGFWGGLWHGIIAVPDFIGMLIWPDSVSVYAENNNGGWYAFGFLLGIGAFVGGCSESCRR